VSFNTGRKAIENSHGRSEQKTERFNNWHALLGKECLGMRTSSPWCKWLRLRSCR
jgi:hypothetical protein